MLCLSQSHGRNKSWICVSIGLGCMFTVCVMHAGPGGGYEMRSRGLQQGAPVSHARPLSTTLQSTCAGGHGVQSHLAIVSIYYKGPGDLGSER